MHPLPRFERRAFSLFRLLFVLACLALVISSARASAVFFPVTPSALEQGGFVFDINAEHRSDGTVRFHVVVTAKNGQLPANSSGSVGTIDMSHGWESAPGGFELTLKGKKSGASLQYDFTVPERALSDPRLFFIFSFDPVPNMPAVDLFYARLKDFSQRPT